MVTLQNVPVEPVMSHLNVALPRVSIAKVVTPAFFPNNHPGLIHRPLFASVFMAIAPEAQNVKDHKICFADVSRFVLITLLTRFPDEFIEDAIVDVALPDIVPT